MKLASRRVNPHGERWPGSRPAKPQANDAIRPGVNRSRPADPCREGTASPLPGSARQPAAMEFCLPTWAFVLNSFPPTREPVLRRVFAKGHGKEL